MLHGGAAAALPDGISQRDHESVNVYLSEAGEAECNCYMVVVAVTTLLLYIQLFMNVQDAS